MKAKLLQENISVYERKESSSNILIIKTYFQNKELEATSNVRREILRSIEIIFL